MKIVPWLGGSVGGLGAALLFNEHAVLGVLLMLSGYLMIFFSSHNT